MWHYRAHQRANVIDLLITMEVCVLLNIAKESADAIVKENHKKSWGLCGAKVTLSSTLFP